jgi:hypothetical protein
MNSGGANTGGANTGGTGGANTGGTGGANTGGTGGTNTGGANTGGTGGANTGGMGGANTGGAGGANTGGASMWNASPTPGEIPCGENTCDVDEDYCCGTRMNRKCISNDRLCPNTSSFQRCDGPEDCGDREVCCMKAGALSVNTACTGLDFCAVTVAGDLLCHNQSQCPATRPACCATAAGGQTLGSCQTSCRTSPSLPF